MLHFSDIEFARRRAALKAAMEAEGLDCLLLFAPESHYWLTGFDTFGFCFFQCLIWDGEHGTLLTRSADRRQAELTSTLRDIRVWTDGAGARPAQDLAALLAELGLRGGRIGVEWATHGLTAAAGQALTVALESETLVDASGLISPLRLVKSDEEIACVRAAARLADAALEAALPEIRPGADEGGVLAAMHGAIFRGGGTDPGNPFIAGAGPHALLCRSHAGRTTFGAEDQLTLEWAGTYLRYHAAAMQTVIIGQPHARHRELHEAVHAALMACEARLRPGRTMGEVFAAHAETLDAHGLAHARLNACGYSMGARFAPSWMEREMFFEGAPTVLAPGMVFFLHMIAMESETGTAMSLGRTSLVTEDGPEPLNAMPLEMLVV